MAASTSTTGLDRGKTNWLSPFGLFSNIRLAVKLPLIISTLGTIMATIIAVTSYLDAERILSQEIENKFFATLESRRDQLEQQLNASREDIVTQSRNPTTLAALKGFALAWRTLGEGQKEALQTAYIASNPHPADDRAALVSTQDGSQYDLVHTKFHPYYRGVMNSKGYFDIFLVDTEGNVVYSANKETDFATNLVSGAWRDTGLAQAYAAAITAAPEQVKFTDFTFYAPSNDTPASFLSVPITSGNETVGALIFQMPKDRIMDIISDSYGLGATGEVMAIGEDYLSRSASRYEGGQTMLSPMRRTDYLEDVFADGRPTYVAAENDNGDFVHVMADRLSFLGATWAVVIEQHDAELLSPVIELRNTLALQLGGLVAILLLIGWLVGRAISRPFGRIGKSLQNMALGDLSTPVPLTDRKEDVGALARNLEDLRSKLNTAEMNRRQAEQRARDQQQVVEHLTASIRELAQGKLTTKISTAFADDYETLRDAYNSAVQQLHDTVALLLGAAQEIDVNARDVETASNDMSQKAIEQAASLEQTAAAITELSASVKSTADAAGDADSVMTRAKADALQSGQIVTHAMTAMDKISSSSQKITQVTSVIEDLAFQTNLLALNAGVEAARAGEAGRGFAVVASEVRALAQRSSDAAKEINALIQESADNVGSGVELVAKAGTSFDNLIGEFDKVSASVTSIASAAREQAAGIQEINAAVDQLDGVTQKNAAVATQVHGTGKVMVSEAARLMQVSSAFQIDGARTVRNVASEPVQPLKTTRVAVNAPVARADDIADETWAEF